MIIFLRKIRERLLSENKLGKYLIYAVGEILLVVIGILIALQINDWNKNQNERLEEKEILKAMQVDFIESKNRISETIFLQERVIKFGTTLSQLMIEKEYQLGLDSIEYYLFDGAISHWRAEPVTGTYDALIGAGKTGLIQNNDLRRILAEFSAELNFGFEDHNYSIQLSTLLTDKSSKYVVSMLYEKDKTQLVDFFNDKSFVGILLTKNHMEMNRLRWQKKLLKYTTDILEIIDTELLSSELKE